MSVQEFLNSVSNPRTRKGYRFGLNKFLEWFGKSAEELLAMRQEYLTRKLERTSLSSRIELQGLKKK